MLGSASMAAFMSSRIQAELPSAPSAAGRRAEADVTHLPTFLHEPFAAAMSQSMLLPAFVSLAGVVAAIFFVGAAVQRIAVSGPARAPISRTGPLG